MQGSDDNSSLGRLKNRLYEEGSFLGGIKRFSNGLYAIGANVDTILSIIGIRYDRVCFLIFYFIN